MFPTTVAATDAQELRDYRDRGWTVTETSTGPQLVTDDRIAAVELTGHLAATVRRYLRANNLSGPVIEIRDNNRREIHLVVGAAKAVRAIEMLRGIGVTVYADGATVPLPHGQSIGWGIAPTEARWIPPLVALSAGVSAARTTARAHLRNVAC
ncbi:hypothetical protein OHB26_25335 [Nocardia sp. NBC_01503]|uniref:hypothetical protein n=1 Tax=Nocardia sp. NBC_01503 TaxID=2975997 RepID=UPI002E7BFA39|nr:hypothetical protein [Nocardia sp. NBC_01503]WTL30256.1 hypothetical protein OHB26_25335 [Nocardia sp. NBC_01503]